jgi:hypothetical protein
MLEACWIYISDLLNKITIDSEHGKWDAIKHGSNFILQCEKWQMRVFVSMPGSYKNVKVGIYNWKPSHWNNVWFSAYLPFEFCDVKQDMDNLKLAFEQAIERVKADVSAGIIPNIKLPDILLKVDGVQNLVSISS